MFRRAILVAVSAAVLVPFAAGPAHASCLDDTMASNVETGYTPLPKSQYWTLSYVQQSGTATVSVYGDALLSDYYGFVTSDVPEYGTVVSGNTVAITTTFADCVAG